MSLQRCTPHHLPAAPSHTQDIRMHLNEKLLERRDGLCYHSNGGLLRMDARRGGGGAYKGRVGMFKHSFVKVLVAAGAT